MTYEETIQYLYNRLPVFHQIGAEAYKPGLDNSIRLMSKLGNPQDTYKTIHIAGTNGKGSTSHFLSAILQSAKYKVGLYTSPHLVDFRERIRVNGEKIAKDYVVDFVKKNEIILDEIQPSFFEATMAMAFQYFADCEVDIAIIEVGLGGRLDSTNIIRPILSVITNIGMDHTEFLGDTLEKIAGEKAGIIKNEIPVVIGETNENTKPVFLEKAKKENAPITFADKENHVVFDRLENDKMIVIHPKYGNLLIGLSGEYQLKNIATVISSFEKLDDLGVQISWDQLKNGLEKVVSLTGLQGRWQIVKSKPIIVLDTGHNKEGIQYVSEQLKRQVYNKLHVVFGMVDDKDIQGVLSLLPKDAVYYFTAADTKRAVSPETVQSLAEKFNLHGESFPTVENAVHAAIKNAGENDFVFIGGSNYIVGEALPIVES